VARGVGPEFKPQYQKKKCKDCKTNSFLNKIQENKGIGHLETDLFPLVICKWAEDTEVPAHLSVVT
jgi:hypothetical protein